jgi:RNA polymerase sigma-70 factor (ECF subfamily)
LNNQPILQLSTLIDSEKELVQQIKAGNKLAFDQVFRLYYTHLCNFAFQFLKEKEAAEEITQEVFYKLWEKHEDLAIHSSFKSYLFQTVRNRCLNQIKHLATKEKYKVYNQEQISLQENTVSDAAVENELANKIQVSVTALPTERQKIFRLSRDEGLKYKEIASQLSISIKTVEAQMGKALKFLRVELADFLPTVIIFICYLIK